METSRKARKTKATKATGPQINLGGRPIGNHIIGCLGNGDFKIGKTLCETNSKGSWKLAKGPKENYWVYSNHRILGAFADKRKDCEQFDL